MAELHILTPEQVAEREHPKASGGRGRRRSEARARIIEDYKAALQEAQPGYGADVRLAEGEEKRVVRQNLKVAADELQLALDFRPIRDPRRMHFRVITPEERAVRPKRRGGRPRTRTREAQAAQEEQPVVAQGEPGARPNKRGRRPSTAAHHKAAAELPP